VAFNTGSTTPADEATGTGVCTRMTVEKLIPGAMAQVANTTEERDENRDAAFTGPSSLSNLEVS
jgi:hypothetical protein